MELNISSSKLNHKSIIEISEFLQQNKVMAQLYPHISTVKNINNEIVIENAIKIVFTELDDELKNIIKLKIWPFISTNYFCSCAFINCYDYKGCILNWPGVYTKTNCLSKINISNNTHIN
jgi:hypothetical protein